MRLFTIDEIKTYDENVFKELLRMNVREDNARSAIFKVNATYLKNMTKSEFIDYVSELSFTGIMTGISGNNMEDALGRAFRNTPCIYNEFKDELGGNNTTSDDSLRV